MGNLQERTEWSISARLMISALFEGDGHRRGFGLHQSRCRRGRGGGPGFTQVQTRASSISSRSSANTVPDAMIIIDETGDIVVQRGRPPPIRLVPLETETAVRPPNVSCLITPARSHRHDEYVAHYLQTGERRIIGSSAASWSGQRRDGSTFPMVLSVGEAGEDGQRHWSPASSGITTKRSRMSSGSRTVARSWSMSPG